MRKPRRLTQLLVAILAVFSMVATTTPASANVTSGIHISTKKKSLSKEQKVAKAAVAKAEKILKAKEKSLKAATKALAKAQKNLDKARKKAGLAPSSLLPLKASTKAMKAVVSAQRVRDRAAALVDSRTRARDKAQADLTNKQAKYAWLMADLSTMDCGVGSQYPAANGAIETVNECGIVFNINDGDTVWVKTTQNSIVEVRNIGLQTPELSKGRYPEQCGATAAKQNFLSMMTPEVTVVQLRSITGKSNNWLKNDPRAERSIYILNPVTGLFDIDVQAEQMKAGWSFYWPSSTEWTHNKEYLGYLFDARANQRGIWNPTLCGDGGGTTPDLWLNADSPNINGGENAFGEYVVLHNPTNSDMNLQGWSLRDGSLDFFSRNNDFEYAQSKFQANAVIPANGVLTVYISNPAGYTLTSNEISYFRSDWRMPSSYQIANGSLGTSTNPNYAHGDGIYLLDPKGNVRASMLSVCSMDAVTCEKPSWLTSYLAGTPGQIIPHLVTLSMWQDSTRDTYNPTVSITTGATAAATKSALEAKRFTVFIGTAVDSPLAANRAYDIQNASGTSVLSTRVPIAQLPANSSPTALTVIPSTGYNTLPPITGLSEADARAALTRAGFTVGTVGYATGATPLGAVQPSGDQRLAVGTAISFTVNQ